MSQQFRVVSIKSFRFHLPFYTRNFTLVNKINVMKKLLLPFLFILLFTSCKKTNTNPPTPPVPVIATLTATAASAITLTTATSGGNISSDGEAAITARGVCWNTSAGPTVANSKTNDGTGTGVFTSSVTGLTAGTIYYIRAYATNSAGTAYGNEIIFTTLASMPSVTICTQVWMLKNLDVSTYRNGDPIPQVTDSIQWANLTTGAWCYYNNDPANGVTYGKLYNWYAVNDPRGLAPTGWHVPSDAEWNTLSTCLGGYAVAGGAMKETGTTHWTSPNTGATNSSGFTGLPGGARDFNGTFSNVGNSGIWWSSTGINTTYAWYSFLYYFNGSIIRTNYNMTNYNKRDGFSVRASGIRLFFNYAIRTKGNMYSAIQKQIFINLKIKKDEK